MHKISPSQFLVSSTRLPSREEFRLMLPHFQDEANEHLRSVSDYWQCRVLESGVAELLRASDGNEQIDIRYDANNDSLYLGASASCVLDLDRHIHGVSDDEADSIFISLARMEAGLTLQQSFLARGLIFGAARMVAPNRWRGL